MLKYELELKPFFSESCERKKIIFLIETIFLKGDHYRIINKSILYSLLQLT